MKYETPDYAYQRLDSTVVRINKEAVYIQFLEGWHCNIIVLATKKNYKADIRKVPLDLNPIPLGYINRRNEAIYLTRKPLRKYKQGLSRDSLVVKAIGEAKMAMRNKGDILLSPELSKCVDNIYPSLTEAFNSVEIEKAQSVAFSRVFAINRSELFQDVYELLYKNRVIGSINREGIDLESRYLFLKEMLEECTQ
jgi:hypothetical protein